MAGTPRCRAINDYVFDAIGRIKPDIVIVGGYFAQYDHEANWRYPGFLDALVAGARRLHADGVRSIIVAGEVPTWAPVLPILVGRDVLEHGAAAEFSWVGVRPDSLETDRALAAKDWGEGVRYVSQAAKLCGPEGCRRLIGETLPEDLLAIDYGHYSLEGSVFAVRTILAPVIRRRIGAAGKELTPRRRPSGGRYPAGTEWGWACAWATGSRRVIRIGRLDVRADPRVDRIVLEMQQAEAVAGPGVVGAPVVKGEELEVGHADRLLDPQGRRNLHGVAERHRSRLRLRPVCRAFAIWRREASPRAASRSGRASPGSPAPGYSASIRTGWRIVRERTSTASAPQTGRC